MAVTVPPERAVNFELAMHQGHIFYDRIARTYRLLTQALVEATQNAVDAGATRIFIGIDETTRQLIVLDNGNGVTRETFARALKSVGESIKDGTRNMGRFGLGLMSLLDKCEYYAFTSMPSGTRKATQWFFNGTGIRTMKDKLHIPSQSLDGMPEVPAQFAVRAKQFASQGNRTTWRTAIQAEGVTENSAIGTVDLDDLSSQILVKLGRAMREKSSTVFVYKISRDNTRKHIEIIPSEFSGSPLEAVELHGNQVGRVIFTLYRARRHDGTRTGRVELNRIGDNAAISCRDFRIQAMGTGWLSEIQDALRALESGYFEGTISAENITLADERDRFLVDDALRDLYASIDEWWQLHGKAHYAEEQEQLRGERYENLGTQSLERLLHTLETDPDFAGLMQGLNSLLPGRDSGGLQPEPEPRESKEPKERDPNAPKRKRFQSRLPRVPSPRDPGEKPDPENGTGGGLAISFAYEELLDSNRLWEFNVETGVVTFNIRHPLWIRTDRSNDPTGRKVDSARDRRVMNLQEWLTLKIIIVLVQHGEEYFEIAREDIDSEAQYYVPMFINRKP